MRSFLSAKTFRLISTNCLANLAQTHVVEKTDSALGDYKLKQLDHAQNVYGVLGVRLLVELHKQVDIFLLLILRSESSIS
jgi:hypothetical protein